VFHVKNNEGVRLKRVDARAEALSARTRMRERAADVDPKWRLDAGAADHVQQPVKSQLGVTDSSPRVERARPRRDLAKQDAAGPDERTTGAA